MVQPYNIGVKVGADIDPLRQELNKGSKEIQGFASRSTAALRTMASGFAIIGTAAVAAGGAILKLAAASAAWADDISDMADAAGTSAEMFQEMTFASRTLGIEQQKLSDIMKNSQKNLGEFALTGGGPLKKFFDDVLYKTGQTKEAFRDLSGPQGLQQFYNALEKAKLPQDQIISQMEKLAAGSSTLIPLLRENGAGFAELGRQAREVGGIVSNEGVSSLADLNSKFDLLKLSAASSGRALAELLTPEVNKFVEAAITAATETTSLIGRLKEWRAEKERQSKLDEEATEIIENQSEATKQGTIVQKAAASAINDRLREQNDLMAESEALQKRLHIATETRNISDQQFAIERLAQIKIEQTENQKMIEFLRIQSAEAAQILELRTGIANEAEREAVAQADIVSSTPSPKAEMDEFENFIKDPFEAADPAKQPVMDEFSFGEDDPFATEQELFAQHWEEMNRIAVEGAGGISQIMAAQWGNAVGSTAAAGKSMLESFSQSSRKMFEINKAWGIADAIVSTAQGIAAGVKLGWPMGIPAVAWAVASGAAQISKIRSTQFGGGGSAPAAVSAAPQGQAAPGTNAQGGQESGRTLRIEGLRADSLYTGNQLQNLASNLEEFWNDGGGKGRVIFAGDK